MDRPRTVQISINHVFKCLVLSKNVKKKRNPNANAASFIKSEVQKFRSLAITIKVTYKINFCSVPQEGNEELPPTMKLRLPCPGHGLDNG